jgi:hypothetical protein
MGSKVMVSRDGVFHIVGEKWGKVEKYTVCRGRDLSLADFVASDMAGKVWVFDHRSAINRWTY